MPDARPRLIAAREEEEGPAPEFILTGNFTGICGNFRPRMSIWFVKPVVLVRPPKITETHLRGVAEWRSPSVFGPSGPPRTPFVCLAQSPDKRYATTLQQEQSLKRPAPHSTRDTPLAVK